MVHQFSLLSVTVTSEGMWTHGTSSKPAMDLFSTDSFPPLLKTQAIRYQNSKLPVHYSIFTVPEVLLLCEKRLPEHTVPIKEDDLF